MKNTNRKQKILEKKVLEYFFNNPHNNSYPDIQKKFKINKQSICKILTKEFDRRFKLAKSCRKHT